MKYDLGDRVWIGTFDTEPSAVTCPDCGGTLFLTVTLFNGDEHTIDCLACERGYDGPQGEIRIYKREPHCLLREIVGVRLEDDIVKYDVDGRYGLPESEIFDDNMSALKWASERCEQLHQEDLARVAAKANDQKSWAWNCNYHRAEIRRAQKSLDYHASKLDVAKLKAKVEE
jgi:hypothetical protein